MYYKLPVKERIELMKSYRKANKDMSYQDMVKDYNSSYEKFNNGGKKEINLNLKNQESNTPLSTWNQNTDWLGEKYNDVGLNFNKNNLNIGIGNYVPRSTFEKVGNINPYLNVNYNLNDKSSIGGSFSKDYNGISFIQKFGNGGKKEVTKTVVYTDKAAFDKAYKAEKDSLYAYNLTSRDKYADKVNYMRMNLNSPNMSKEDIAGFTNLYKETDDYYKNINEPYRVVTVTKTKNNPKNDTSNILEQYLKNTKFKPEEYKVIKDKQLYGQTYYSYDPKTLKVTNPVHKYENKITPAKFLAKEFPKITDKDVQNLYNKTLNDGSEPLYYTGKLTPNQEQIKGSRTPKAGYFPAAGVVENFGTHISVIPYWKKPVIHNIYEPPVEPIQDTIKPAIKDTVKQKPIVNNVDSVLTKHWNFNGPNPVMEYYDKSGKLINKEYYDRVNGKKIEPITK